MSFYERFFRLPLSERRRISEAAGISLAYIHKHTYVSPGRDPKFKLENAIALDKASGGNLPLWEMAEGDIDWGYVLDRLKQAKRHGAISVSVAAPSSGGA